MMSKSISSKKCSATIDPGGHLFHSRKRLNSDASDTHYIALPGDTPTKITFKRYPASSTSSSSKILRRGRSSTSKLPVKNKVANGQQRGQLYAKALTIASKLKKNSFIKCSTPQAAIVLKPISTNQLQINKTENVNPLHSTTDAAESANNDRKRAAPHDAKSAAKKPRISTDSQSAPPLQPPAAVQCTATSSADSQTAAAKPTSLLSTALVQSTAKLPQTSLSTKRQCLATSIISFSWKSANALYQMQQHNNKFKQQIVSLPAPSFVPPTVTAIPPMPPDWINNYEDTIMSLLAYKRYEVCPSTMEYKTIETMLNSIQVKQIRKIVNPDLWKRFVNNRKEMLRSKTDDLNVLSELGLDERDVMRCTHIVLNQTKNHLYSLYSDNMALLFHCTKNGTNLNNIMSQGLDERLSNVFGGRLGKGIYFADDPQKALQYDGTGRILIFAVLLGDCISVDHFPFKNALVREPEKHSKEMRNMKDIFFDSIVGRPAGYNEFVIYNRHQCCPLYEIEFERGESVTNAVNESSYAVKDLPPFAWLPDDPIYAVHKVCEKWPFYADEIFKKMGALPVQQEEFVYDEVAPLSESNAEQLEKKLATLFTFGFCDAVRNREALANFNNDLYLTLNFLLDNESLPTSILKFDPNSASSAGIKSMSSVAAVTNTQVLSSSITTQLPVEVTDFLLEFEANKSESLIVSTPPEMDECSICCNEYESYATHPTLWQKLKCGHKLCASCHSNMLTKRTTISLVDETFLKCPFCHDITGVQIGTCPNIQMNVTIIPTSCEGFAPTNTISINYFIDDGYQLNRTAYLPNNDEGKEVLRLLKIAWDRRLCFTIGESLTTGQKNVLVWGIHHKTSMRGGALSYGYPDPGYMDRVKCELKSYGIQ